MSVRISQKVRTPPSGVPAEAQLNSNTNPPPPSRYCLIQFYMPISGQLAPYKPILKFFAVKAVVFLTFWQSVLLGLLSTIGVIKSVSFFF